MLSANDCRVVVFSVKMGTDKMFFRRELPIPFPGGNHLLHSLVVLLGRYTTLPISSKIIYAVCAAFVPHIGKVRLEHILKEQLETSKEVRCELRPSVWTV